MDQVEKAFNGRYREVNRETQQWYTYNHPVPEPRPGVVSTCLLPSAGEPVDNYTSVLGSMWCQLHEPVWYTSVCSSVTSSVLTDDRAPNRYPLSWRHSPPLFLYTILIKLLSVSFPGRLITGESLKSPSKRNVAVLHSCALRHYPMRANKYLNVLPLQCITNAAREQGISSSLHMPDKVLNFVKDHFLMDSVIRSQPLLLKRNVRYTQIAVHLVRPAKKAYHVLFIGTGKELHTHNHTQTQTQISTHFL